jgi:diguanylate cyclase (GGDEF)-like protein
LGLAALVLLPEFRLLSLRGATGILAGYVAAWSAVHPEFGGFWSALDPLLEWRGAYGVDAGWVAIGAAALLALGRWIWAGGAAELALALALTVVGVAFGPTPSNPGGGPWILAAVVLGGGALVAAYRMAFIDPLTGLPNRRALDERLARSGGRLAVAMVDVDHFKRFNDRYGHESGDRVLRRVARQLRRCRGGTAYRYGGEEFAIVFEGRALRIADAALEAVRERIEATGVALSPQRQGGKAQAVRRGSAPGVVHVTVSMGLADQNPSRRRIEEVLEAADKALYRAKQRGRNRLVVA